MSSAAGKWIVGPVPILFDAVSSKEIKRWVSDPVIPRQFTFTPDEKTMIPCDRS